MEGELEAALSRPRYAPRPKPPHANADGPNSISGHRHGHRSRSLIGTFGPSGNRDAARQAQHCGRQNNGMKVQRAAGLPAADPACGCINRGPLPCREQHTSRSPPCLPPRELDLKQVKGLYLSGEKDILM
jgi:hypothetical protein